MMERLHAEVGRIHPAWRSPVAADACDVEMICLPFRRGPGQQRATVERGCHRHAREMDLVALALVLDLGAWTEREPTRARALGAGHAGRERARDDEAQHDPCENDWKRH